MKQKNGSTSLFLIELVLVILIFSLCAAVTMKAFATAKMMTQASDELSSAVTAAQSAAECYKASNGNLAAAAEILNGTVKGQEMTVYYSSDWLPAGENADYMLLLSQAENGKASISVYSCSAGADSPPHSSIFDLTVKAVTLDE